MLQTRREEVRQAHRAGADGWATCEALTRAMDDVLRRAFEIGIDPALRSRCALMAIGGYGRNELCPHSDIDIMVLIDDGGDREAINEAVKQLLHLLWDAGLDVGHSVRTQADALALHGHSHDAWTTVLESRFLAGNEQLARKLGDAVRAKLRGSPDKWYIHGVFDDMQARHERFGSSVKLLEPNIKKSAGGLRDVHMVFWLHRGVVPAYLFPLEDGRPATATFLDMLQQNGELEADDVAAIRESLGFLFRTRHEMHFQRESENDILEYALQRDVAAALGFGGQAELRSVEVFMAAYYRHGRIVHRLHRRLSERFRDLIEPASRSVRVPASGSKAFRVSDKYLFLAPGVRVLDDAAAVFECFALAAESGLEIDFRVQAAIERGLPKLREEDRRSPGVTDAFRRILRSGRAGEVLRIANDLDLLGWLIPAFGDLVSFFQHNVYHYFTADEHTLIAIANAERLATANSPLGEAFRGLPDREVIILAALLHDIAKPLGVSDHEITGVAVAERVLADLGVSALAPRIGFLVRHHLLMEQTAFRRNVHDPATIREFAARFDDPVLLEYLYVLTYADLSAVNTSVWTEWKSAMLHDLYMRTADVLERNLRGTEIDDYHATRRQEAGATLAASLAGSVPAKVVADHLRGMNNDAYQAVFTPADIAKHIEVGRQGKDVNTFFDHRESFTDVTVIARDAPFALSRFCAVLTAHDANIFDANIFTRADGLIIDRFRVSGAMTHQQLDAQACERIAREMEDLMAGRTNVEGLFREHHRKWKRRTRGVANPNIRTDVEFEETPGYTIIDVYAPDSVGFLFRITEAISRLGLNIMFAKIATRVDGIVDSFYVLERSGQPVSDDARRGEIREGILAILQSTTELRPA
jgi:[protein-PII] uridylyltransferase